MIEKRSKKRSDRKLKATEWRGYEDEDEGEDIGHPQNLLKPGTDTRNHSKYDKGKPNEDWTVFKVDEESMTILRALGIFNWSNSLGIKRISSSLGSESDEFEELIQIEGIEMHANNLQLFPLDAICSYFWWRKHTQNVKLRPRLQKVKVYILTLSAP